MNTTRSISSAATTVVSGLAVQTAVKAGGLYPNHAEGIVVSTTLKAGQIEPNHVEGLVR